jgi:hypothetical protein
MLAEIFEKMPPAARSGTRSRESAAEKATVDPMGMIRIDYPCLSSISLGYPQGSIGKILYKTDTFASRRLAPP